MNPPTPIPNHLRARLGKVVDRLPDVNRVTSPRNRATATVEGLVAYLDAYVFTVEQLRAADREARLRDQRAGTVLRGLRMAIDNAVSTLAELDAADEAGDRR